jgi:FkbM family methyltransferase
MSYDLSQHPIFGQFTPWSGRAKAGFEVDFLGRRTDVTFTKGWADAERSRDRDAWPPYPAPSEETFEWLVLMESVLEAIAQFNMIELGAGYGRWVIAAACAIRRKRSELPYRLMAVEGDATHFRWLIKHFLDNGIDPQAHRLIHGAVNSRDGEVLFTEAADPSDAYGQLIIECPEDAERASRYGFRPLPGVPGYALETLLKEFRQPIDLIDIDIQGSELAVLRSCPTALNEKVRRVHIGTHGRDLEAGLRAYFRELGWQCQCDFANEGMRETPFGTLCFADGAQTWRNPRLVPPNSRAA